LNRLHGFFQIFHPIVYTLLFGTILARAASSMSLPFLAIYLAYHSHLGATQIGLVIGAGALASTVIEHAEWIVPFFFLTSLASAYGRFNETGAALSCLLIALFSN
jgi:hypothetical protein